MDVYETDPDQKWTQRAGEQTEISKDILKQSCFYDPQKIHQLDIGPLLPFLPKNNQSLGRTVDVTVREVLEEYLHSGKDRYSALNGKYMLYIEAQRNLGAFKTEVISKEIRRRICKIIHEKQEILSEQRASPPAPVPDVSVKKKARAAKRRVAATDDVTEPARASPVDYELLAQEVEILFRPVWNVRRKHITAYIARHARQDLNTEDSKGAHDHALARRRANNDLGLLVRSAMELTKAIAENRRMVLILPVFFDTLTHSPYREHYLEFCMRIPPQARSLMVLQIKKIPVYAPKERLREMQREITGLVRSLIITTDLRSQNLDCLLERGIHACTVLLPNNPAEEQHNISLMERFVEKMETIGRAAMVDDVFSKSMLSAALAAGFIYIAGTVLQPDQKALDSIRPFCLDALYDCS